MFGGEEGSGMAGPQGQALSALRAAVRGAVEFGQRMPGPDDWATPGALAGVMRELRDWHLQEAVALRGYAADEERADDNRAGCRILAEGHEAEAAKYAEHLAGRP
jgi:hypothetical protein